MPFLTGRDERESMPEGLLKIVQCSAHCRFHRHCLIKPLEDHSDSVHPILDIKAVLLVLFYCLHGLLVGKPNFDNLPNAAKSNIGHNPVALAGRQTLGIEGYLSTEAQSGWARGSDCRNRAVRWPEVVVRAPASLPWRPGLAPTATAQEAGAGTGSSPG